MWVPCSITHRLVHPFALDRLTTLRERGESPGVGVHQRITLFLHGIFPYRPSSALLDTKHGRFQIRLPSRMPLPQDRHYRWVCQCIHHRKIHGNPLNYSWNLAVTVLFTW